MPLLPAGVLLARLAGCARPAVKNAARTLGVREVRSFGPVPLPSGQDVPGRQRGEGGPLPADRDAVLGVCCFGLSLLGGSERQALFVRLSAESGHTFFFDFKTPERNLEWPSVLFFSPLRRCVSSGLLERQGGMEGFFYEEQKRFSILSRHTVLGGAFCGMLVRNLPC